MANLLMHCGGREVTRDDIADAPTQWTHSRGDPGQQRNEPHRQPFTVQRIANQRRHGARLLEQLTSPHIIAPL